MIESGPHGGADAGLRPGERAVGLPGTFDASVYFIGRIRTPWIDRRSCPRRGDLDGPLCRVELDPRWMEALRGVAVEHTTFDLLYWMHLARRDLVHQNPKSRGTIFGTFGLRSPMRPNPIAVSMVRLVAIKDATLLVRGLDCVDGTPLVDIKPSHCPEWPPEPS